MTLGVDTPTGDGRRRGPPLAVADASSNFDVREREDISILYLVY